MEMRNFDNAPTTNEPRGVIDASGTAQSLEQTDQTALVPQQESADDRTELYARLRTILDNATESIRTLKEENATLATQNTAMSDQIGALEQHLRAVTTDLANDELALRRSAEALEQVLQSEPTAAPQASAASPTPLHASEPESESPRSTRSIHRRRPGQLRWRPSKSHSRTRRRPRWRRTSLPPPMNPPQRMRPTPRQRSWRPPRHP